MYIGETYDCNGYVCVTQRSVSQENALEGANTCRLFGAKRKTIGSNNSFTLIENNRSVLDNSKNKNKNKNNNNNKKKKKTQKPT